MSKVVYEVMAKTGKYTDKQGQEKNRWTKCGVIFQCDKGLSLKLEAMPVGSDGWFSLFEPKDRQAAKEAVQRDNDQYGIGEPHSAVDDFEDRDIPF